MGAGDDQRQVRAGALDLGPVADVAGEDGRPAARPAARDDRQLDLELAAVAAPGGQFDPPPERLVASRRLAFAAAERSRATPSRSSAGTTSSTRSRPTAAPRVDAEEPLRRGAELEHGPVGAERDHGVEHRGDRASSDGVHPPKLLACGIGSFESMKRINVSTAEFAWDDSDPDGFRAGMARVGPLLGAARTGATVYELPPGQAICPYHYELGEEEWLLVLSGTPTLRTPAGKERLGVGDLVFFATGPEGAHGIGNESDEPARVLMFSEVVAQAVTVYPDSDKVGIWTGNPDVDLVVRRSSGVEYYEGET